MEKHIRQAEHNKDFHLCIDGRFKDRFYDWKITVLFYIAIHCLKALAIKKTADIGENHREVELNINPDNRNATFPLNRGAYRSYRNLYQYSKTARYDGIVDFATFERLKEADHLHCLQELRNFQNYISTRGIDISTCILP